MAHKFTWWEGPCFSFFFFYWVNLFIATGWLNWVSQSSIHFTSKEISLSHTTRELWPKSMSPSGHAQPWLQLQFLQWLHTGSALPKITSEGSWPFTELVSFFFFFFPHRLATRGSPSVLGSLYARVCMYQWVKVKPPSTVFVIIFKIRLDRNRLRYGFTDQTGLMD